MYSLSLSLSRKFRKIGFAFLAILLIFIGFGMHHQAKADITSNLIARWSFEEGTGTTVADGTGNGSTGTLVNGPTFVTGQVVGNYAIRFNNTNQYMNLGSPAALDDIASSTYAFWLYTSTTTSKKIYYKVFTDINTYASGLSRTIGFSKNCTSGAVSRISAVNTLDLNQWNHFVITWDGTCTGTGIKIYKNGVEVSSYVSVSSGTGSPSSDAAFSASVGFTNGGPGDIDEFRIYNRALSSFDAVQLYNDGAGILTDTTPPVVSSVATSSVTSNAATITWSTNEGATSRVRYGLSSSYTASTTPTSATTTSHNVALSGLTPSTTYHFMAESQDSAGNIGTSSDYTFTTAAADITPPVISSISSNTPGYSSATITWNTNESATSLVEYGTSTVYTASSSPNSTPTTSHSRQINGLLSNTTYHYRVISVDGSSNTATSTDQTFTTTALPGSNVIPPARLIEWTAGLNVGVPGGIDQYVSGRIKCVTTACADVENAATGYKDGTLDARALIQAAIDSATAGTYVYVPAGTWRLNSALSIGYSKDNITLRGAGMDVTNFDCRGSQCITVGSGGGMWSTTATTSVTSGLARGSTQITVADATNFVVGQLAFVRISDEKNPLLGPVVNVSGYPHNRKQVVRVTAKTGNTLSIFPGLYGDFDGLTAYLQDDLSTGAANHNEFGAVEDLTVNGANGSVIFGIMFAGTYGGWVKNVRSVNMSNYNMYFVDSLQCEMRQSYLDELNHAGSNGAGLLFATNSGCLIEDNIIRESFPNIEVNHGASGNVFAYNFLNNNSGSIGIDTNHGPHNTFNLYEGNIVHNIMSDGYFGGEAYGTIFRNWITGKPYGVSGASSYCITLKRFTRGYSIVGNILNKPAPNAPISECDYYGQPNIGNGSWTGEAQPSLGDSWGDWNLIGGTTNIAGTLTTRTSTTTGVITLSSGTLAISQTPTLWKDGAVVTNVIVTAKNGSDVTVDASAFSGTLPTQGSSLVIWPGAPGFQELDLDVASSTFKKGNYSNFQQAIPASESLGGEVLPNSLFRSSKPSYFGSLAWPAFEASSPNQSYEAIPAAYRYVNGTGPGGDVTAPSISVVASSTTQTTATITWNTNESATSTVEYGATTSYGTASSSNSSVTSHSIVLAGLTAGTAYHFRVSSADSSNNYATSSDYVFTTAAADVTPPIISSIASSTGQTTALVTWTTNESATSTVEYGLTTSYGTASTSAALVTSHSIALSGLTSNTLYHFRVSSRDASGNIATSTDNSFMTTNVVDSTAPILSAGSPSSVLAAGTTGATLSVTTDETATCRYGTVASTAYASIASTFGATGGTTHTQSLTGLADGISYTYYIRCTDGSLNANTSDYAISFSVASSVVSSGGGISSGGGGWSSGGSVTIIYPNATTTATSSVTGCPLGLICASTPVINFPAMFTRDLKFNMKGNDVKELQKFLNSIGFIVAPTGAGSKGKETTLFGPATRAAVIKFQKYYKIYPSVGYFGPLTREFIKAKFGVK